MTNSNVVTLNKPERNDPLQELLRDGARKMLATAIEAEVAAFIEQYSSLKTDNGLAGAFEQKLTVSPSRIHVKP